MRRLSKPALNHIIVFNMAVGILRVRKFEDVVSKAVNISTDKKRVNQKRKQRAKFEEKLEYICNLSVDIFKQMSKDDLNRLRAGTKAEIILKIPEATTNPELLALNMLFLNFQEMPDPRMDEVLDPVKDIDYLELMVILSEEFGLEKDIEEEMLYLADHLIAEIKK